MPSHLQIIRKKQKELMEACKKDTSKMTISEMLDYAIEKTTIIGQLEGLEIAVNILNGKIC